MNTLETDHESVCCLTYVELPALAYASRLGLF